MNINTIRDTIGECRKIKRLLRQNLQLRSLIQQNFQVIAHPTLMTIFIQQTIFIGLLLALFDIIILVKSVALEEKLDEGS